MTALYNEIRERFPEVCSRICVGDEELPYTLMHRLADWLKGLPTDGITPEVANRIVAFCQWCEQQPSGSDASDDLLTILVVGFHESLFDAPSTRVLLPLLFSLEDMTKNVEYLRTWVGDENYNATLKEYRPNA